MKTAICICVLLFFGCFAACNAQTVEGSNLASVRYVDVESITYETGYDYVFGGESKEADVTHFVYTFAMWKVNEWADRAFFTAYINRDGTADIVANWSVGFSVAGGLQGIYIDWESDLVSCHTIMAEFPYATESLTHEIDGTKDYRLYRMHFYFAAGLFKDEVVTVAADYMKTPDLTKDPFIVSAETEVYTGDMQTLVILDDNEEGYTFQEIGSTQVVPESPFAAYLGIAASIGVFVGIIYKKRNLKIHSCNT
jgi:hypothetical protein